MINARTVLEVSIGDRMYRLECLPDSPLGELHDALTQMKFYVMDAMRNAEQPPEAETVCSVPCEFQGE